MGTLKDRLFSQAITLKNSDKFGVDATYEPVGGSPVSISGTFEAAGTLTDQNIETTMPIFFCAETDVENDPRADMLTINPIEYKITNYLPDGLGGVFLHLEEQSA